jgi:type II secretory pathway component PulJ
MFGNQSGFSLVGSLVSLTVLSAASLGFMKLMTNHFRANAAVSNDLERESMKRSILQRVDCEKTGEAIATSEPGKVVPVELRSRAGRPLLAASTHGQKIGKFHYRALNLGNGVIQVESRMVDASGAVVKHPILSNVKAKNAAGVEVSADYDWAPLFSPDAPLCDLRDLGGSSSKDRTGKDDRYPADEAMSAELVYLQRGSSGHGGYFKALRGDIAIHVELVLDGGLDCQSHLEFQCDGRRLKITERSASGSIILSKDRTCEVRVVEAFDTRNCASGSINGKNGLTVKQGFNQWRIQWEDRLGNRDDSKKCAAVRDPVAKLSNPHCQRLSAIDWNDAIWHIRGVPVRRASAR